MGNVLGNLTQGELVQVVGRLMVRIGENIDAGKFNDEDGIAFGDVVDIMQSLVTDALKEYSDTE